MITKRKFLIEMDRIDANIALSPDDMKNYWRFFKKGFSVWYFKDKHQEWPIHSARLGFCTSTKAETRLKGIGYWMGFNNGKVFDKISSPGRPSKGGVQLPVITVTTGIETDINNIARELKTTPTNVRLAAYMWYCNMMGRKLDIDTFIDRREEEFRREFFKKAEIIDSIESKGEEQK